jgi:hypothetical protein
LQVQLSRRTLLKGALAIPFFPLAGCGGGGVGSAPKNPVRSWTDLVHEAVIVTKPYPPAVARAYAMVATAMFDAWAAYDQVAVGTGKNGALRRPLLERTDSNKTIAGSFAAFRVLSDLFPTVSGLFDAEMARLGYDRSDLTTDTSTPAGIGNTVAADLLGFRHADGSNQLGDLHVGAYSDYSGYAPRNTPDTISDPNHWQPLEVSDGLGGTVAQKYASAAWGSVRPFALTSGAQFRTGKALSQYGSDDFRAKCKEVIDASANLTDAQKVLAEYWSDGPGTVNPPGHWMRFADWISERDRNDLDRDVKLFFVLANALLDAGIACWDTKRIYDSVRPVTAIHYAFKGQTIRAWGGPFRGTVEMDGESFGTFQSVTFVTPAFPSYVSGHSAFSAAAAEVLKRFTGSDTFGLTVHFGTGSSALEPGLVPLSPLTVGFSTFTEAANSAAESRIHGGIHFSEDNVDGLAMGRRVGPVVFERAMSYIVGTA